MDLYVTITDENNDTLGRMNIYQDGSDSEGTARILRFLATNFEIEWLEEIKKEYRKRFESEDYDPVELARIAQEF